MTDIAWFPAVEEMSNDFGWFFTSRVSAAGKIPSAKVSFLQDGVTGIAAIICNTGAIVRTFDTRAVMKEQVKMFDAGFVTVNIQVRCFLSLS